MTDPKARAVERALRRLGVAIKTFGLHPTQHPVATGALDKLLGSLPPYLTAHGPFVARISRHHLDVDGITYGGEIYAGLASTSTPAS